MRMSGKAAPSGGGSNASDASSTEHTFNELPWPRSLPAQHPTWHRCIRHRIPSLAHLWCHVSMRDGSMDGMHPLDATYLNMCTACLYGITLVPLFDPAAPRRRQHSLGSDSDGPSSPW